MYDLEVKLKNQPGALAQFGEILGKNGISLEGGGIFTFGKDSIGHFLIQDGNKAQSVLEKEEIEVLGIHPVLIQKLKQDVPGQLGLFCKKMSEAGVNILVQYSDHNNQLILVVDNMEKGLKISEEWKKLN